MLRLAVSGPFCVGKTSLATAIAHDQNKLLIPEQARIAAQHMGIKPGEVGAHNFVDFQRRATEYQYVEEVQLDNEGFVSDCSLLDYTTYTHLPPDDVIYRYREAYAELLDVTFRLLGKRLARYSHLVFVPVMFGIEHDGVRHTDNTLQQTIQEFQLNKMLPLLRKNAPHTQVLVVTSDGVDNRVAEVRQWLASLPSVAQPV